jgi:uncharacterized protein (TIGR00290 family)
LKRVALSWSSGKDSTWALHVLRQSSELQVVALITTFNCTFDRVAMHAVRRQLVTEQAERTRLPLWPIDLPWPCSNADYEALMMQVWHRALAHHIDAVAFGDLFLQDIRDYREKQLEGTGLEPLFPIWGLPTSELARNMIRSGIRAKLTCVDARKMDPWYAGKDFDEALLPQLPPLVDPCGENGEFHTFTYDAPVFSSPINVTVGETVERDGFVFADLVPATS